VGPQARQKTGAKKFNIHRAFMVHLLTDARSRP
jgi:hypothetical protein